MGKILIIGANGKIGKRLILDLSNSNYPVSGMVRNKNKNIFPATIELIEADLETDINFAMEGINTVIFSAGSGENTGLDKTFLVDLWGACKAIDSAKKSGISHFIMISSIGADNPDFGSPAIKPYLVAKHFADEYLINSGINYTILRPGRLTDEDGTGLIKTIRPEDSSKQLISRDDTSRVIKYCINNKSVLNKIYELYKGQEKIEQLIT